MRFRPGPPADVPNCIRTPSGRTTFRGPKLWENLLRVIEDRRPDNRLTTPEVNLLEMMGGNGCSHATLAVPKCLAEIQTPRGLRLLKPTPPV